ncbi:MAG TPA: formate dehydrogenase accessory sulfurtransferase FdhD [Methanomicrobiales archaeon]|jgi:FdhD protein|nr:formate dehydrogenase accessory sulfurtransferase FdhD [Methanomicrobiales archaeon]
MYRELPCTRLGPEGARESTDPVAEEVPVTVTVNGRQVATAMTSPGDLGEFALGFLYTEGIIRGTGEIDSIQMEKNGVKIITKDLLRVVGPKRTILSGCGGSASFLDPSKLPKVTSTLTVPAGEISRFMKELLQSEIHQVTGGVHAVGLCGAGELMAKAFDIGRHNALDRLCGQALLRGIDLGQAWVVSSGRISSEMVRKCLVGGIPLIASRGATTTLAVSLAEKNGLTVIGFVRGGGMNIYANPQRVVHE